MRLTEALCHWLLLGDLGLLHVIPSHLERSKAHYTFTSSSEFDRMDLMLYRIYLRIPMHDDASAIFVQHLRFSLSSHILL